MDFRIPMRHMEALAFKLQRRRLARQRESEFRRKPVPVPRVVIAQDIMYRDTAVDPRGQEPQRAHRALRHHVLVLDERVEYVAEQDHRAGRGLE